MTGTPRAGTGVLQHGQDLPALRHGTQTASGTRTALGSALVVIGAAAQRGGGRTPAAGHVPADGEPVLPLLAREPK